MHRWALNNLLRFFSGTSHSFTVFTIYSLLIQQWISHTRGTYKISRKIIDSLCWLTEYFGYNLSDFLFFHGEFLGNLSFFSPPKNFPHTIFSRLSQSALSSWSAHNCDWQAGFVRTTSSWIIQLTKKFVYISRCVWRNRSFFRLCSNHSEREFFSFLREQKKNKQNSPQIVRVWSFWNMRYPA